MVRNAAKQQTTSCLAEETEVYRRADDFVKALEVELEDVQLRLSSCQSLGETVDEAVGHVLTSRKPADAHALSLHLIEAEGQREALLRQHEVLSRALANAREVRKSAFAEAVSEILPSHVDEYRHVVGKIAESLSALRLALIAEQEVCQRMVSKDTRLERYVERLPFRPAGIARMSAHGVLFSPDFSALDAWLQEARTRGYEV